MDDLARMKEEYSRRERLLQDSDRYSALNPAHLFMAQQRQRAMLELMRRRNLHSFAGNDILELGCGGGGVLAELLAFGADPARLHGLDLLYPRLVEAHHRLASAPLVNGDGSRLPYASGAFDLALQFTAFSSILDDRLKACMAAELLRVLKPGGSILWYDFWLNPTNRQTRGIRPAEIRSLFPACAFDFHKVTLAPPIARRIVPFSWGLALFLESLHIFNSHWLVAIQPQAGSSHLA